MTIHHSRCIDAPRTTTKGLGASVGVVSTEVEPVVADKVGAEGGAVGDGVASVGVGGNSSAFVPEEPAAFVWAASGVAAASVDRDTGGNRSGCLRLIRAMVGVAGALADSDDGSTNIEGDLLFSPRDVLEGLAVAAGAVAGLVLVLVAAPKLLSCPSVAEPDATLLVTVPPVGDGTEVESAQLPDTIGICVVNVANCPTGPGANFAFSTTATAIVPSADTSSNGTTSRFALREIRTSAAMGSTLSPLPFRFGLWLAAVAT